MTSKLEYLKKYMGTTTTESTGEKKKRKKKSAKVVQPQGIKIIDADYQWQPPSTKEDEEDEENLPVVVDLDEEEEDEAARLNRTILERAKKLAESGKAGTWVTVAEPKKPTDTSDVSPPRKRARRDTPSPSPPRRRTRGDSPSQSPPRRRTRNDTPSPSSSPPRRRERNDSPSPPRRRERNDTPSPARRRERNDTPSPPRRRERHDSPSSPPRRRERNDTPSPPRRRERNDSPSPPPKDKKEKKAEYMSSGQKAGLRTHQELSAELAELQRKEREKFATMDSTLSGRDAKTVYRDKKGRKMSSLELLHAEMKKKEEEEKKKKKNKEPEMEYEWGKGLVQKQIKQTFEQRLLEESQKPFARYADDEDLNQHQRERDRWGDPMAKFLQKTGDESSSSGSKRPVYKGPQPPPNRFGIQPGFRWDGVDRSNGFEAKMFDLKNKAVHRASLAYKWSVEDM